MKCRLCTIKTILLFLLFYWFPTFQTLRTFNYLKYINTRWTNNLLPRCNNISTHRTTVRIYVCYACSVAILVKAVLRPAWKIASILLSAALTGVLLFSSFLSLVFGDLGVKTVVSSAPSPQKTFTAEVIDSNQGALGGSTLVLIRSNNAAGADLLLCKFSKAPVCVYTGHWGEFQTMKLAWKDERTLIINGMEYAVA